MPSFSNLQTANRSPPLATPLATHLTPPLNPSQVDHEIANMMDKNSGE